MGAGLSDSLSYFHSCPGPLFALRNIPFHFSISQVSIAFDICCITYFIGSIDEDRVIDVIGEATVVIFCFALDASHTIASLLCLIIIDTYQ